MKNLYLFRDFFGNNLDPDCLFFHLILFNFEALAVTGQVAQILSKVNDLIILDLQSLPGLIDKHEKTPHGQVFLRIKQTLKPSNNEELVD